jgi:hypothetical protein
VAFITADSHIAPISRQSVQLITVTRDACVFRDNFVQFSVFLPG